MSFNDGKLPKKFIVYAEGLPFFTDTFDNLHLPFLNKKPSNSIRPATLMRASNELSIVASYQCLNSILLRLLAGTVKVLV